MIKQSDKALRPEALLQFTAKRQLPLILQTEISECGLACLAMVAGYHGLDIGIVNLRQRYVISSQGARLSTLIDIATKLELSSRPLKCELANLKKLTTPCILHWGMNHFVVLKSISQRFVDIHDPAIGARRLDHDEFNQHFTGIALELTPTPKFKREKQRQKLTFSDFWTKIVGLKRNLLQLLFLSFLLQLFALVSPFYMQTVIDDVLLSSDQALLLALALGFGLLLLIDIVTTGLREFIILSLSNRMSMQMSANLFRHLIKLPIDYFAKRHVGDITSRFNSLHKIREALTSSLVIALVDGAMTLLTLLVMFFYDAVLALVVLGMACVYIVFRLGTLSRFQSANMEQIVASAKEMTHFIETVGAIQTIKIFGMENDRQHEWQNRLAAALNKGIRVSRWQINYTLSNKILFGVENILVIYLGAMAVIAGNMSLGMLIAFISYKTRFTSSIDSFITEWMQFKLLDLHMERLADIALFNHNQNEETTAQEADIPTDTHQSEYTEIRVNNLGYRYSEYEPWIFRQVSFTIQSGESIAITGPSGCGKTTLLKCMMGLLQPTEGEVLIDGKPVNRLPHYRSLIAGVMQDDQLLAGDIANNISCFESMIDMEKVKNCARMACIDEDIQRLPMQYNTLVGDMGSSLSGGQKQRIILARALYRMPQILFMDEATSHLDTGRETLINANIKTLKMTKILAAHREKTIASADRVISMETINKIP